MKFRTLHYQQLRQCKAKSAMTDTSPTTLNRTLPTRLPNSAYRVWEYLTEKEVDRLIEGARKRGRNGARDAAAILLAYRHGLRAAELCALRWAQVDLRNGRLHVNRAKGGTHDHWRIISAIAICNRRPDIQRLRRIDLRSSGRTSRLIQSDCRV